MVDAVGTLRANEAVTINSKQTGNIRTIRFEDGQLVERGAVLVELDDAEARAQLAVAEADRRNAQQLLERSRALLTRQAVAEATRGRTDRRSRPGRCRDAGGKGAASGSGRDGALRRADRPAPGQPRSAGVERHGDHHAGRYPHRQAGLPRAGSGIGQSSAGPDRFRQKPGLSDRNLHRHGQRHRHPRRSRHPRRRSRGRAAERATCG